MKGKIWSVDETYIAFLLYCQIPFGQIHKANEQIIKLAALLDRSPSSVSMKLGNLAANDPLVKARGLAGLKNCSRRDKQTVEAFHADWDGCIDKAQGLLEALENRRPVLNTVVEPRFVIGEYPTLHERWATVKERVSQSFFRNAVLASYRYACCITGLMVKQTLIASHIKPWAVSGASEKANPTNGLCLNAFHDRLFDSGMMTVTPDFVIHYSHKLKELDVTETEKNWLARFAGQKIIVPDKFGPKKEFLEYHNDSIFVR